MRHPRPRRPRALTLIETLAVCVVLALAATLSIGTASTLRGPHERHEAASAARDALRRARVAAQSPVFGGGAEVAFGGSIMIGAIGADPSRNALDDSRSLDAIVVALPVGWTCGLVDVDRREVAGGATLRFDGSGRCADAWVALRSRRGDMALVEVLGLSGQTRVALGEAAADALRELGILDLEGTTP